MREESVSVVVESVEGEELLSVVSSLQAAKPAAVVAIISDKKRARRFFLRLL
jgi:hypothetical protein